MSKTLTTRLSLGLNFLLAALCRLLPYAYMAPLPAYLYLPRLPCSAPFLPPNIYTCHMPASPPPHTFSLPLPSFPHTHHHLPLPFGDQAWDLWVGSGTGGWAGFLTSWVGGWVDGPSLPSLPFPTFPQFPDAPFYYYQVVEQLEHLTTFTHFLLHFCLLFTLSCFPFLPFCLHTPHTPHLHTLPTGTSPGWIRQFGHLYPFYLQDQPLISISPPP